MGRDDDHKALRDHFQQWARRDISSGLDRRRQWRNTCDYADDATPKVSVMLGQAIREAQKIVDNLTQTLYPMKLRNDRSLTKAVAVLVEAIHLFFFEVSATPQSTPTFAGVWGRIVQCSLPVPYFPYLYF